jgi:hypothetical protein
LNRDMQRREVRSGLGLHCRGRAGEEHLCTEHNQPSLMRAQLILLLFIQLDINVYAPYNSHS